MLQLVSLAFYILNVVLWFIFMGQNLYRRSSNEQREKGAGSSAQA